MNPSESFNKGPDKSLRINAMLFPQEHMVAFYTFLSILLKMKQELGLEAMLEYMGKYLLMIDSHNPKITAAVGKALKLIPADVIFKELNNHDQANP